MKLYLDLIFFLNFSFDFMLLLTVSVVLKRNVSFKRIFMGALIGAMSIFCLFIKISSFTLFLFKLFISVIMIIVTFKFKDFSYFIKNMGYFYMVSIILGGFLYYLNIEFSYKQEGLVFYHHGLSINFVILVIISPIILYNYIRQARFFRKSVSYYHNVSLMYKGIKYNLFGYLDTGNTLKSPYSNKCVSIINKNILTDISDSDVIYIKTSTVSSSKLMKCIKVSYLKIDNKYIYDALVGISYEDILFDGVDILLNRDILEDENLWLEN